jgi:hypothetical protein
MQLGSQLGTQSLPTFCAQKTTPPDQPATASPKGPAFQSFSFNINRHPPVCKVIRLPRPVSITKIGSSGKLVLCHCPCVLRLARATPRPCTKGALEVHQRCTRGSRVCISGASRVHLLSWREARENRPGLRLSARPAFQLPPPPEPSFPGIIISRPTGGLAGGWCWASCPAG